MKRSTFVSLCVLLAGLSGITACAEATKTAAVADTAAADSAPDSVAADSTAPDSQADASATDTQAGFDGKPLAMGAAPFVFPPGFLFGTAIAQYQAEGTWLPGGATITSNWAAWEALGRCNGEFSKKAAGFREQWAQDLDAMQAMGLQAFRFSLDWARLEPKQGQYNLAEMQHVIDVIKGARSRKMQVFLTFYHWSTPLDVSSPIGCDATTKTCPIDMVGTPNSKFAERFEAFVKWVVPQVKADVDHYPILNEPFSVLAGGYLAGIHPPGFVLDFNGMKAAYANLAFAHARAAKVIRTLDDKDADGDGIAQTVGLAVASLLFYPLDKANPADLVAAENLNYVANYAMVDALVTGKIDIDWDRKTDNLTTQPPEGEYPELKGTIDWIGVNFYGPARAQALPGMLPPVEALPVPDSLSYDPQLPHNELNTEIDANALLDVFTRYANRWHLPMYVTENGSADAKDTQRPRYIVEHLAATASAIASGIDIRGYFHWSILDNFEWSYGSVPRFGLFRVDYTKASLPRTKTGSAQLYADIIGARAIDKATHSKHTAGKYLTDLR